MYRALLIGAFASLALSSCETLRKTDVMKSGAEEKSAPTLALSDLVGVWDVELYFDPDQPPSVTVMEVTAIDEGAVSGAFYGSEFSTAQAVMHNGFIIFSAITSDGTGPYAHGMRMHSPNHIYGQTLSTGRDFVMPWEATKRAQPNEESN